MHSEAPAECQVTDRRTSHVERVWIVESSRIAVRSGECDAHELALLDRDAADLDILERPARDRPAWKIVA